MAQIARSVMEKLQLYLEQIAGEWFAWIEMFPGAYSQGATPHCSEKAAPVALRNYIQWLRQHGETPTPQLLALGHTDIHVAIAEIHPAEATPDGREINGFFGPDGRSLTNHDIAD